MSRYIDADKIIYSWQIDPDGQEHDGVTLQSIINKMPSIDAVPVIRCKDCKYWHREIYNGIEYFNFSSCDLNHCGYGHNFYCADAERRES